MKKLHLDFETRSAVDIKKVGAWVYARHPSTEIICLAFAVNEDPVAVWPNPGEGSFPQVDRIVAHSAHFEYAVYNYILHGRFGWPALWDAKMWDCTMARALMCGLPASLVNVGLSLGLKTQKMMEGRAALMKVCKPKGFDPLSGAPYYDENPATLATVYKYCGIDVETEREADKDLPELTTDERKIFELDLEMNRRGLQMDVRLAQAAVNLVGPLTEDLNTQLRTLTAGAVGKASQVGEIKRWLGTRGLDVSSINKENILGLLANPHIEPVVKEVLSIRQQVGKSSTAKFQKTLDIADPEDGRARGLFQFNGAFTGRFAGRLIQPHNYPKGIKEKDQLAAVDCIVNAPGAFSLVYGARAMHTLSDILRGTIIASPGKTLVCVDYNAIEARVLFWEADDAAALSIYGRGGSPYLEMAEFIFQRKGLSKEGNPFEYAVGKKTVLGCGYQMAGQRFQGSCASDGIHIEIGMSDTAVRAYREKFRSVVQMWYATERAFVNAVVNPGSVQLAMGGKVMVGMDRTRKFLVCKLPSGRFLFYYKPSVVPVEGPRGEKQELRYWSDLGNATEEKGPKSLVGVDGPLGQYKTYGGALVENITQAIARDIMVNGMVRVNALGGYDLVGTVHDEIIAEHENPILEDVIREMCTTPAWAKGCPIAAEGWVGQRYRK